LHELDADRSYHHDDGKIEWYVGGMSMDVRKMNLPLPAQVHAAVFREARRAGIPATRLVRQVLGQWLSEQARAREADEIRCFAAAHAGSQVDLDPALAAAGLELLEPDRDDAQR
jgi:hypothetical protein